MGSCHKGRATENLHINEADELIKHPYPLPAYTAQPKEKYIANPGRQRQVLFLGSTLRLVTASSISATIMLQFLNVAISVAVCPGS
jgi:hypothetical protein